MKQSLKKKKKKKKQKNTQAHIQLAIRAMMSSHGMYPLENSNGYSWENESEKENNILGLL